MPPELAPPVAEPSFAQREARSPGGGGATLWDYEGNLATTKCWFGAVANNALKLFVCSYRHLFSQLQSKLFEPRCFVPIPALKINLATHDYHLVELGGGFLSRPTPSSTKPIASTTAPT